MTTALATSAESRRSRPVPRPPATRPDPLAAAIDRAVHRDSHLTAAEAEAWQRSRAESKLPRESAERLAPYLPLLKRMKWHLDDPDGDGGQRLEAVHRSGARVMIVARRRCYGVRRYGLLAPGQGSHRWRQLNVEEFTEFLRTRMIPPGAHTPHSACRCKKRRFASEHASLMSLVDCKMQRDLHRERRRREKRAYRCLRDPRVWHLTSWAAGPTPEEPADQLAPTSRNAATAALPEGGAP
ncbi:hypothetical protein ACFXHD_09890 [Streptomyces hydrogenans]|uniref:hypothetical protein n=1 Tax=Streptomyces hydrogenans TaxID=1873719 RepID=UPI0036CB11A6